ncbi:MAG TPA: RsmE family RNA methyltransferase [Puia sp.]|nr:RsmE family RNA methyltransferase [Puia sp.]
MSLPFFYIASCDPRASELELDEGSSKHVVQVLRMEEGEELSLTDGKGNLLTAVITGAHKRKCRVAINSSSTLPPPEKKVAIAISPIKSASRFEWFLEKATEIGISEIIPLLCDRTERQVVREDRLQGILVSAMLQSRQVWLPVLRPPTPFSRLVGAGDYDRRLIAWLGESVRPAVPGPDRRPTLVLIGPEGDFSRDETAGAMRSGFVPVSLGPNRLRTETAGVVAATLLCIG